MVPAIHADTGGPQAVIVAGASIGAFNALALVCRYPHLFRAAVCMSGTFDIERFIGGFTDDLFFSSPLHFLPGLEGPALDAAAPAVRRACLRLGPVGGRRRVVARPPSVLGEKGVPNRVDDWGPELRPRLADLVGDAAGRTWNRLP